MGTLIQDLRFAFRQLSRAPSFAVTAVLTLALGIGANTAIFSLVNSLLLKPLPVENPQQLAELAMSQNHGPLFPALSWQEFKQIRAQGSHSFSDVIAHTLGLDGLATQGQQPQRILTSYVSGNFFNALGLKPAAGRLFPAVTRDTEPAGRRFPPRSRSPAAARGIFRPVQPEEALRCGRRYSPVGPRRCRGSRC